MFLSSCFWQEKDSSLNAAEALVKQKKYEQAVHRYETIVKSKQDTPEAIQAAREGAKLSFLETKDYSKALFFYRYLVLYSPDKEERLSSQKTIIDIYFERLSDNHNSVIEINRMLQLDLVREEELRLRLILAKSLFYLNSFDQALAEVETVLDKKPEDKLLFEAKLLRGNIFFASKKLDKAAEAFEELMKDHPELAKQENLGLTLAICYEEQSQFTKAEEVLTQVKSNYPNPVFIEEKIIRLRNKAKQQPGARGYRK